MNEPIDGQNEAAKRGIAPADAVPRAPWPQWRKITAYALLTALSLASIWYVDRKVHLPSAMPVRAGR